MKSALVSFHTVMSSSSCSVDDLFRGKNEVATQPLSIYINTIRVTKHLQEQGLSAFYLSTTVIRQVELVSTTQLLRLNFNVEHEEVERHLARVLDTTG